MKSSSKKEGCLTRPPLIRKRVKAITPSNFAAYGRLIDTPKSRAGLPPGFIPGMGHWTIRGPTEIAACSLERSRNPIGAMERHLHTPEVFIVVEGEMIVGLSREEHQRSRKTQPVAEAVEFFLVREGQGIIMRPGLWHIVFVPRTARRCCFYIIFAKDTAANDWFMPPFRHGKQVWPCWSGKK